MVDHFKTEAGARPAQISRVEPVETEPQRKRRKLREFMVELAPGYELEYGISEVSPSII